MDQQLAKWESLLLRVINNNINNINNNIISLREDERTLADDLILCKPPKWRLLLVRELFTMCATLVNRTTSGADSARNTLRKLTSEFLQIFISDAFEGRGKISRRKMRV